MHNQQRQLTEQLSQHGWKIAEIDREPSEWWIDEQWLIESEWSPQGFQLWLAFVVDPQWEGIRKKGEGVWAIRGILQAEQQGDDANQNLVIPLRPQWDKRLPSFIAALNRLRDCA